MLYLVEASTKVVKWMFIDVLLDTTAVAVEIEMDGNEKESYCPPMLELGSHGR